MGIARAILLIQRHRLFITKMSFIRSKIIVPITTAAKPATRTYMEGPGGRFANNNWRTMQGVTAKSLKSHYSLIPLWVVMGFATAVVVAYLGKLATNKDTNWVKAESPMEHYRERTFKLVTISEGGAKCQAPDYRSLASIDDEMG